MTPRCAAKLAVAVLLVMVCACDGQGGTPPESSYKSYESNLGLVATTQGDTLRTFPLSTEAASEPLYINDARFVHVGDDYLLARTARRGRIFDLSTGKIVAELPVTSDLVSSSVWTVVGRRHPDALILTRQRTGPYAFADTVELYDRLLRSSVQAVQVAPDGDTSETALFETAIRKRDSTHFVTTQIRAAVPYGDGTELLYVRDREITTVTPREGGDPVLNRFFFERSLWRYDRETGTREKLLVFPPPAEEVPLREVTADVVPNSTGMAYAEGGRTYYADLRTDSVVCLNDDCESPYGERLNNPSLSPSGSDLLVGNRVIDLEMGRRWRPFTTTYGPAGTWGPDGKAILFSDRREGTVGVWGVPFDGSSEEEKDRRTLRLDVGAALALNPSRLHNARLSRPVFLNSPQRFAVFVEPPR